MHFLAGHSLSCSYDSAWTGEMTWTLDGLIVSNDEGAYLRENRPWKYVRTPAPPDWGLCVIDGLEITEAEAMRIRDHEDPRQVLLDGSGKYRLTAVLWKPA